MIGPVSLPLRWIVWVSLALAAFTPTRVSLVELTSVSWKPGRPLPTRIQRLDGARVWTVGYMHATDEVGMNSFPLVATLKCQCGGTPTPDKFLQVILEEGTTDFQPDPVAVVGVLEVGEVEEDGFVTSIYRLRGRLVR